MIKVTLNEKPSKDILVGEICTIKVKNAEEIIQPSECCINVTYTEEIKIYSYMLKIRKAIQIAKERRFNFVNVNFDNVYIETEENVTKDHFLKILVEQLSIAGYKFESYLTKKQALQTINVVASVNEKQKKIFHDAFLNGYAVNIGRELGNIPAGDLGPERLASMVKQEATGEKDVEVTVLSEEEAKKAGMHMYLSVGQGTHRKSQFIILNYKGGKKNERPVAVVGKGVCFDSGGINLKPYGSMIEEMHRDMTGAAVAISTFFAVVKRKIAKNVVAIIPAVENAISDKATHPGDIVKASDGSSVWVGNTDAEGRLILGDALTYVKKFNPKYVFDIATLTGAAMVCLGHHASAYFTEWDDLAQDIEANGKSTLTPVWRMPLWNQYYNDMKSDIADIGNISTLPRGAGGTCTAAAFLWHFTKSYKELDIKWAHFDILPRMVSSAQDNLDKGSLAEPLLLLVDFIENK